MANIRRKLCWPRVGLFLLLTILVISALSALSIYAINSMFHSPASKSKSVTSTPEIFNKRINILLLGLDDGEEGTNNTAKRSDTMIIASLNSDDGSIELLSIPRDTRVTIPGRKNFDKIAHAYFYGGADLAVRTVEDFLRIPVDYYVTVDWQGFINIVDVLGGLDLYVESNMDYDDPYANLSIHLTKGYQHLDGQKAGQYVRFRHDELGDIGRVQRQQRFLKALGTEMLQVGTIIKLPALIKTLNNYIATNMNVFVMAKLANTLKGIKINEMHTEMIPGNFATIDDLSYWIPDKDQVRQMVDRMLLSSENTKISGTFNNNSVNNAKNN